VILYRSRDLVITDRKFVVLTEPSMKYAVTELNHVHVVCEEIQHAGRTVARYVGAWAVVLIVVSWALDSPAVLGVALVTLAISAALGWASNRRRSRNWELRAHDGRVDVCLYSTSDEQTFGQVKRAMIRALEANERW
jgi:hypothetical protein